jgi:hypothetical protein
MKSFLNKRTIERVIWLLLAAALWLPHSASACAACYGQSDSKMAVAMNWGIFSLLAVIVGVLTGVAGFFFYISKRSGNSN